MAAEPLSRSCRATALATRFGLHGLEKGAAEDRLMLAAMHLTPIGDLAEVEPVLEQMGKRSDAEADTTAPAALPTKTIIYAISST
jgi:hypothetical protein